jgi:prepilin peptidase CpaA
LLGPAGAFQSIAGWTLCLLVFLPFYATGGMAGGDVKLIAMVGAFLGPVHGLLACFATLTVGALIGLLCIIYQQLAQRMAGANKADAIALQQQLQSKIPYAGAIAAGTALAVVGAYSFLPAAA